MSVQTEIDRIINCVSNAHAKVLEKGGTTSSPYLVSTLADAIDTIPTGSDPVLQEKTVTPKTSAQSVTPDSGYDGLSKVTVNAMPTATQATPSISVNSSGLITASATQTAGYVAAGTKSATKQLTTQAAKTITPSTSSQTAVAAGRYTTGAVTVAAIPSTYVKPTGTLEITENGTYDVTQYASARVNVAGSGSGGGGSVEMCTVAIMADVPVMETTIIWLDTNGNVHKANYSAMDLMMGITLEVAYNTFIYSQSQIFTDMGDMSSPGLTAAGGIAQLIHVMASGTFVIN